MNDSTNAVENADAVTVRTTDGEALHCLIRRGGEGIPFLFVHGLASNARLWDGAADRLARLGHDSVAVDQRSHGRSSPAERGFDFSTLADDLAAVITSTLQGPVVAVGQSWGGNVVLELADLHPDLVAGVALIDGGFIRLKDRHPQWENAATELAPPALHDLTLAQLEEMIEAHHADFPRSGVDAQLANFRESPDGTVRPRLPRDAHMTILRHLWEHEPDLVGARVTAPIVAVAVEGGYADPARVSRFGEHTGANIVWVQGHHDVHAQQPELVADLLHDFARGLSS